MCVSTRCGTRSSTTGLTSKDIADAIAPVGGTIWEHDGTYMVMSGETIVGTLNIFYSMWVMYVDSDTSSSSGPWLDEGADPIYITYRNGDNTAPGRGWVPLYGVPLLPPKVTGLAGIPFSATGRVTLNWNSTPGASDYFVYRDDDLIATSTSAYFIDYPGPGTYEYTVSAENTEGVGPLSDIVTVIVDSP